MADMMSWCMDVMMGSAGMPMMILMILFWVAVIVVIVLVVRRLLR